ncbi:double zinc ribbon domain-containing protein [Marinicrinis lubricantis]|uniref:Zinc ribbon domain-containing protein n=1 Tax=Marinicrinis lubricantis TaxID=2086470 RepID=A0ABW1IJJ7_9BACL
MTNFFDKIKKGARGAGKKAQETVEINRIKMQIKTKQKEISRLFMYMGDALYQHMSKGEKGSLPGACVDLKQELDRKITEKEALEERIRELKHLAKCASCGQINVRGVNFCAECGHPMGTKLEVQDTKIWPMLEPPNYEDDPLMQEELFEQQMQHMERSEQCPHCGHPVFPGKRFCHQCGRAR